jgi:hypothetical protein
MTRDLRVGTAELVIDVDVEEVLVVVAVTEVILPPDTVIETATDPYWCVTVGPANVPSLNPLDDLSVVGAPGASLEVVDHLAALAEPREPLLQSRGVGSSQQGQHQPLSPEGRLSDRISGEESDRPSGEVAVGDRIGRAVGPIEVLHCEHLHPAAEYLGVERQGFAGGTGQVDVRSRVTHAPMLMRDPVDA